MLQRVDFSYLVTDSILLFDASVFESGKALSYDVEEEIHVVGDAPAPPSCWRSCWTTR